MQLKNALMEKAIISKIRAKAALFFLKSTSRGSLLLEIAVGITVLTLMSGFVFRKAIVINKLKHETTTKLNIESVTMAIAAFVSICGRLPYPAHDASGLESEDPSPGYIPYKALGISEQTAKDGYSRPLIYIPEKKLIFSDDQGVYCRNELDTNCFCRSINMPVIEISGDIHGTIVAFAIDTQDHKNSINEDHIVINPSKHTFWISRDMLLMQYLKNAPCAYIKPHTEK